MKEIIAVICLVMTSSSVFADYYRDQQMERQTQALEQMERNSRQMPQFLPNHQGRY